MILSDETWSALAPTDDLLGQEVLDAIRQGENNPSGPANFAILTLRRNPQLDPRSAYQIAYLEGELVRARLTAKVTTAVSIAFVMLSVARWLARG